MSGAAFLASWGLRGVDLMIFELALGVRGGREGKGRRKEGEV